MSEGEISNPDIPDEIVRDILRRLPVKPLLRFRCVSKHWRDLIADTQFIQSHLKTSLALSTQHRILVPTSPLLSLTCTASPDDITAPIEINCSLLKLKTSIKILGSCNGLVCLMDDTEEMIIYNPSSRKHLIVFPSSQQVLLSSHRIEFVYGFGCGLSPDDFRVVRFPRFARDSENNNKRVFGVAHGYDFIDTVGTFLNGSLHWLANHGSDENDDRVVASFSLSEEVFEDLSLPPQKPSVRCYVLAVLQGCLATFCDDTEDMDVDVWVMKEYGVVKSWTKVFTIPLDFKTDNISYVVPLSSLSDDEILLEIDLQSFVVYNAKKKTFRDAGSVWHLEWFGDAAVFVESLVLPSASCIFY